MSADTPNHDGRHPVVGVVPAPARAPQPSPTRPTPPPADPTAAVSPPELQPPTPSLRRPSWLARIGVGAEPDPDGPARPGGPRTATSSASDAPSPRPKVGQAEMAATLAGFVLMLAGFTAWGVSRRGWDLRVPDPGERKAMTDPIASLLARHCAADWLNADLLDVTLTGTAIAAYGTSRPLTRPGRGGTEAHQADHDLTPEPVGATS